MHRSYKTNYQNLNETHQLNLLEIWLTDVIVLAVRSHFLISIPPA